MTAFYIQEQDGALERVNRDEFNQHLKQNCGCHLYCHGGNHIALLPDDANAQDMRFCRQAENAAHYAGSAAGRCLDVKGHTCRYQHDENGAILRDDDGTPIRAKCGDCPRNGWIGGKRENCCIRNYCTETDCSRCSNERGYRVPMSLKPYAKTNPKSEGAKKGGCDIGSGSADAATAIEDDEFKTELRVAIELLEPRVRAIINAIYMERLTIKDCADKFGMNKSMVNRLCIAAVNKLKEHLKGY